MKLLDCTLRDGANVVGNGFSAELTESMIKALTDCGIRCIELGNAKGVGSYEKLGAVAPLTDKEYMELAEPYTAENELGMFILYQNGTPENVALAARHGLTFLRVGGNAGDGKKAVDAVMTVKAGGLKCFYSLMKAYVLSAKELAAEAELLEAAGLDEITIMDSAGTMTPDQVKEYVTELKNVLSIPVGFHGHDNLGLSVGNALAAYEAGADVFDCGLLGMARSAGNCATELLASVFKRQGLLEGVDLYRLLDYLDHDLIPKMKVYDYAPSVTPNDLVYGMAGCHSSYSKLLEKIAAEEGVSLYRLIMEVSKIDRKTPDEALMRKVAKELL